MNPINPEYVLQEFLANVQSQDRIKAALVLEHLPGLPLQRQTRILYELSKSEDRFALPVLFFLARKNPELVQSQPRLKEIMQIKSADNPKVVQHLLEEDLSLDRRENLQLLNMLLAGPGTQVRRLAKDLLQQAEDKALPVLAANLHSKDQDLVINSLEIIAGMDNEAAQHPVRKLLHAYPENPNIRFAAYEALGSLPVPQGKSYTLATGLLDKVGSVRLAAAKAMEKNLDQGLLQGIQNMLQDPQERAGIINSLLEAKCSRITLVLIQDDQARLQIMSELQNAHPDLQAFFYQLFKANGLQELADQLQQDKPSIQESRGATICCVDDSGLILSSYKKILYQLGIEPILFQDPIQALDWLQNKGAELVFTDLSMPGLSGMELVAALRQKYDPQEMTLIAVTAQSEPKQREELFEAGVDEVLAKPFALEDLKQSLQRHLPGW